MNPNYFVFIGTTLLIIISIILLIPFVSKKRSKKQNYQILQLAKDLNLPVYGSTPLKSNPVLAKWFNHPLIIEGNYKGKALKIFTFAQGTRNNPRIHSAIRILGSNPLTLNFTIIGHTWVRRIWQFIGPKRIIFEDPVFNAQFIVKSNKPQVMQKILSNTIREKFIDLRKHHAFKGGIELKEDTMIYVELQPIQTEYKRKRFAALTDLMCCLRDEIDINSKGT